MAETEMSALPTEEDYRRYDRIWRRVSPEHDPYPEMRAAARSGLPEPDNAETEPCRMVGDPSREAEAIRGFLRDELADAQTYRCLAARAPTAEAKRVMRALASDEAAHARTLQAAYFLLTGGTYAVTVVLPPQPKLPWRDRLRGRYHEETCGGFNYARAVEGTEDVCLRRMFSGMSKDEYRHAERLRALLERAL